MPEQFEGGGEKERVAGGGNGAKKKESAYERWLFSCSGTLLVLDNDVVDKLFGF